MTVAWVLLAQCGAAHAAEWYIEPSATSRAVYNTNLRLRVNDPEEVFGMLFKVGAHFGVRTESAGFSISPTLRSVRYDNHEFDTDDQSIDVLAYQEYASGRVSLGGVYERDTTLTDDQTANSELLSTGLVQQVIRKERYEITPTWTHSLSEKTTGSLSATYLEQQYQGDSNGQLSDYSYYLMSGVLSHQLTERDQVSASLSVSQFDVEETSNSTVDYGFSAAYDRQFTPTLSGYAGAGVRFTEFDTGANRVGEKNDDVGLLIKAGLKGKYQIWGWSADFARTSSPTGGGRLVERDELNLKGNWRITERLHSSLRATYREDERLGTNLSDRKFTSVGSELKWKWTRNLSLFARYRFNQQKIANTADSHLVTVGLTYYGDGYRISR